jgi:hypothetical protein
MAASTPTSDSLNPPLSKKQRRFWTKQDVRVLHDLIEAKTDLPTICETLNRTEKSIRRKCDQEKISSATFYKKTECSVDTNAQNA